MQKLSIDKILELYRDKGALNYGEDITQLEHALQCAQCAEADGRDDSLVVAALLHDIGHLFEDEASVVSNTFDDRHEVTGSARLAELFPASVVQPIALHVAAKRYLCAKEAGYHDRLSQASKDTLVLQGGVFTDVQMIRFEKLPYWREAVQLRRYDDIGKRVDERTPSLEHYLPLLEALALQPAPQV